MSSRTKYQRKYNNNNTVNNGVGSTIQHMIGKKRHFNEAISHQIAYPKKRQKLNKQSLYASTATAHAPTSQLNAMSISSHSTRHSNYPIRKCRKETNYKLLSQYGNAYRSAVAYQQQSTAHFSSSSSSSSHSSPSPMSNDNDNGNNTENEEQQSKPSTTKTTNLCLPSISSVCSPFKFVSHPTHPNTKVISLIDDDDDDDCNHNNDDDKKEKSPTALSSSEFDEENEGEVSTCSVSSDYWDIDQKGYPQYHEGLIIANKYKMIRQLGKGTFSRVFECQLITNRNQRTSNRRQRKKRAKYAVKCIRNVYKYQLAAQTELAVLRKIKMNDPHHQSCCIHIIEDDSYKGHPIFVFPLLSRSIYSFMVNNGYKPFDYDDCIALLYQICYGVAYIHDLNIIITDLKPENIMMHSDELNLEKTALSFKYATPKNTLIKLIDFGSAVLSEPGKKHSHLIQTRHYRAPEVVFKLNWSFSADVWSIGCILVELIYGKMLFNTHCSIDHLNQMLNCIGSPNSQLLAQIPDETWTDYFNNEGALNLWKSKRSPVQCRKLESYFQDRFVNRDCDNLYDLCKKMLCWNPNERITAKECLAHKVFRRYHRR